MSKETINLGKKGETLVAQYLVKQGFVICCTNYTTRYGEVDIIAKKDEVLAFVEVKLRRNPAFYLSELIVRSKQQKIIKSALYYISQQNSFENLVYRFDVALIDAQGQDYNISYLENAFTA